MNEAPKHCCALGWTHAKTCDRKPSKYEDGEWFCWQHAPSYRRAKALEWQAAAKKREEELNAQWDARDARRKLEKEAEVDDLSDGDLRIIAKLGGIYAMICALDGVAERE